MALGPGTGNYISNAFVYIFLINIGGGIGWRLDVKGEEVCVFNVSASVMAA